MIIAYEDKAPTMDVPEPFNRTLKVLLSPALNEKIKNIAAGLTILPPSGQSDNHRHVEGEMFYVVSGTGLIQVGGKKAKLAPGVAIWVPSGVNHQLINNSNDILKILWVISPSGREEAILKQIS